MRVAALMTLGCAALLMAGCAGYRLGPTNGMVAGEKSIQVNFFQNKTTEPRLLEAVNSAFRKKLQQDGTFRLNTSGDADIIVSGEITRFDRSGLTFQPGDIITVRDYNLALTVRLKATERATGKVLLDTPIIGHTTIRVGNDLVSAERQAVPMLAEDLARNAAGALVDGKWW
jgi:hypothetical protein